jgi:hypothetical protein
VFQTAAAFCLATGIVGRGFNALLLNAIACVGTLVASGHMGKFWDEKGKIPFIGNYNDAVDSSQTIRGQLALLGLSWGITSFFAVFGLLW